MPGCQNRSEISIFSLVLTVKDPRHPIRDKMMVMAPTAIKTYAADI